jgi:hypothetical protein
VLQVRFDLQKFLNLILLSVAVPWLRRLVAGLSPRRPGFDRGPVHVGCVVDKVALGQVFPRVHRFSPVNSKLIIFITGLHNKPQGCGASIASVAGPLKKTFCCLILGASTSVSFRITQALAAVYSLLILFT